MKNYEIKTATADYTGGGIYIYYGELENGLFFRTCDEWDSISICNSDTSDENADYMDFYEVHQVTELVENEYKIFWDNMLNWILEKQPDGNYSNEELEKRFYNLELMIEPQPKQSTHERIVALEQEILRLRRIEELEDFLNHMQNTFDVLMGESCTNDSVDTFYRMPFTITFNGKTIEIDNGADTFQEIEYTIKRELDELTE